MSHLKISGLLLLLSLYGCGGSDEEKARNFVINGHKHLEQDNKIAAKIEFTNAFRLDKTSVDALYELTLFAEAEQDWKKFESHAKKLLTLNPNHSEARLKLTHYYIGTQQIDLAKQHAAYLQKSNPDDQEVRLAMAAILYKQEEPEAARKLIDSILTLTPSNVDALFLRIIDLAKQSKFEDAIEQTNKGLQTHPDNIVLNMTKIQILNQMNEGDKTIPVHKHIMSLLPSNATPAASLAHAYAKKGDFKQALSTLEHFATANENAEFFIKAIELIIATNGKEQAEIQLNSYIKAHPKLHKLQFALADIYVQSDRLELAYSKIEQLKSQTQDKAIIIQATNRLARMDIFRGNIKEAQKSIAAVLKTAPQNASALALKADLLIRDEESKEAIKLLRGAIRNHPESAELLLMLGRAHEQEQQWELANEHYAKSLKLSPNKPLQTIHYADFLIKRKKLSKAESLLAPLITSGIKNIKALQLYAHIMLNKKDWDRVLKLSESMKALTGDKPAVTYLRSLALDGKGDSTAALKSFKHYFELSPESTLAKNLLVKAYIKAGQKNAAITFVNTLIKQDGSQFNGYIILGNLYTHYKEWSKAATAYNKAITTDNQQRLAHDLLIKLHLKADQLEKAQKAIQAGLVANPQDVPFQVYQATLYQRLNEHAKSIDVYQSILDQDPKLDFVANNLAALLEGLDDPKSLKRAAMVADRFRQSKIPQYQDTLGWIYTQQGNTTEGIALLRRAADKLPEAAEIQYHLGIAFQKSNKLNKAKKHLKSALTLTEKQGLNAPWIVEAKKSLQALNQ